MNIKSVVVEEKDAPIEVKDVVLDSPKANEVLFAILILLDEIWGCLLIQLH